jgi:hypothetical protein
MHVRILVEIADHVRGYIPDEVWDLPDDQAARWIAAGWALSVSGEPEAAALAPPDDNAAMPRARKRGG